MLREVAADGGDIADLLRGNIGRGFAACSGVMGVPIGLWLAAHFSWRMPFLVLAAFSVVVWAVAWRLVPALDAHVEGGERRNPVAQLRAIALPR